MLSYGLHQTVLSFFAIISTSGNGLLIFLVLHRQNHSLGSYRYLLVAFAGGDIIISAYHAFAIPVLYQYEYGVIVFTMAALRLPPSVGFVVNAVYVVLFYQPFVLLAFHFVYRYLALIRPQTIHEHGIVLSVCAVLVNIAFNSIMFGICFLTTDDDAVNSVMAEAFHANMHAPTRPSVLGLPYFRADGVVNWSALAAVCIAMVATGAALGVSGVCAVRIARSISSTAMAVGTRRLQLQLLRALVAQFSVPFVLCIVPIALMLLLPLTGRRFGNTGSVLGMAVALFPAIDPMMVIVMIARFRLVLVQYYVRLMGKVPGVTALMGVLSTSSAFSHTAANAASS